MKIHILVLTLSTEQATLRMRVWRSLKNAGAAVLRDGVYLLPDVEEGYAAFVQTSQEIRDEGGSAYVFTADSAEEDALRPLFDRSEQYGAFLQNLTACRNGLTSDTAASQLKPLRKLRREFDKLSAIDFFPSEAQRQARAALAECELHINWLISPDEPHARQGDLTRLCKEDFRRQVWATRKRPWVDRLASAWLIRRFIDDEARFLWLENANACPSDAIGFDFDGALFSHIDMRVTFEVLVTRFGLEQEALNAFGQLVHYLDVGGIQPAEAVGVESILAGLRQNITDDDELLSAACLVFDGLLNSCEKRCGNHEQSIIRRSTGDRK